MYILRYYSEVGLLVLIGAALLSCLLYLKNIKTKIVPIVNLCSLLVFLVSLFFAIDLLSKGISDPSEFAKELASILLMNVYAGLCNVAARVSVRVAELMGNKRLKIRVQAEIVEK